MPDSKNDGFFYLLYKFFKGLFELILSFFEMFKDGALYIFDYILNEKYYNRFLFIILLTIFSLLFYLIYYINPLKLFNPQTSQLTIILIASLFLTLFYFIAYRNESTNHYYAQASIKNKLINSEEKYEYKRKYEFNKDNFKFSFKDPLINLFKSFFSLIAVIIIPVIIISLLFSAYHNYHNLFYITKILLNILLIITTLAIIAYLIKINVNDTKCLNDKNTIFLYKIICIIKYLIFFVPCLLIIGIENLKEDLKLTPKSIYLLFILELVLICLFFFLPLLFKYLSNLNKHNLLENNQIYYTHKYRYIANYQSLRNQNIENLKDDSTSISIFEKSDDTEYNLETKFNGYDFPNKNRYNYSYSIAFYLYLNPQENNTNKAYNDENGVVLFNYGNKPVIKYNGITKQLIIESCDLKNNDCSQRKTVFKSNDKKYNNYNLKYQKWLYFVINYENNNLDIFIDGKLVASEKNIPNFNSNDKVEIGDINYKNTNGIYGSIKEISYYKKPRPVNNIEFLYDLTKT